MPLFHTVIQVTHHMPDGATNERVLHGSQQYSTDVDHTLRGIFIDAAVATAVRENAEQRGAARSQYSYDAYYAACEGEAVPIMDLALYD